MKPAWTQLRQGRGPWLPGVVGEPTVGARQRHANDHERQVKPEGSVLHVGNPLLQTPLRLLQFAPHEDFDKYPRTFEELLDAMLVEDDLLFGDGWQISKLLDGRRYWRMPTMDGEFVCEDAFGTVKGVGGGNFLILGETQALALAAAEASGVAR